MRRLVVSEFLTLDGVMETPEKWSFPFQEEETVKFKLEELFTSDALLLGKTTYQIFANSWPSRQGDFADRMNSLPKYVVSTTLNELQWNNSHQIKGIAEKEITKLKQQPGQDILVAGSSVLVQTLMRHNLVDEYRLLIHPIILGSGERLFKNDIRATLKLVKVQSFSKGMVLLQYAPES